MTPYEFVKYRPAFKNQVLELQSHLWGDTPLLTAFYLAWKYEQNPSIDTPPIYLALYEGKVVGMRGFAGSKWQIGTSGPMITGLMAGDLVVAPEHRNRGLFSRLMRFAEEDLTRSGYLYLFNLSARPITRLGSLTMGWRSTDPIEVMTRSDLSLLEETNEQASRPPTFDALDQHKETPGSQGHSNVQRATRPRPAAMAVLVAQLGYDDRIGQVRDEAFFAWRYKNPHATYRFLFWGDKQLEGYLVLQSLRRKNKRTWTNIVDWEATSDGVRAALLEAALDWGRFPDLRLWSNSLGPETKALLERHAFRKKEGPTSIQTDHPTILVKPLRERVVESDWMLSGQSLLDLTNWNVRMTDSDRF